MIEIFIVSIVFFSLRTKNALKNHENVCKDHDYCYIEMPNGKNTILKYNPGEMSMKIPFIIHGDFESILEKLSTCSNDPKKSSTTKISENTPSCFSLFTYCSFDKTKNRSDYNRGKDCMEVFCKILKERIERIIYWEKKEMIPLTDEESRSYGNQNFCYVCKKRFKKDEKKSKRSLSFYW